MKISVVFSPVMKVSWRGQAQGISAEVPQGPTGSPSTGLGAAVGWEPAFQAQQSTGWDLATLREACWGVSGKRRGGGQGRPYLCLIDLQQDRPCGEAAVIEQHVGQDGQLGRGPLQGPGVNLQGLLGAEGARVRGASKRG